MNAAAICTALFSLMLSAQGSALAGDFACIPSEAFACKDRKVLDEIISYQNDPAAFSQATRTAVMYGFCKTLSGGQKVYIDARAIFAGLRQVHAPGELERYWVAAAQMSDDLEACAARKTEAAPASKPAQKIAAIPTQSAPIKSPPASLAEPVCDWKPVMSDQEIAACRK